MTITRHTRPPQNLADSPASAAFVATLGHQVVGVFVANGEACGWDELSRIRSEFHVEDFLSFDHHRPRNQALLTALALNPIFAGHCRFALKEASISASWNVQQGETLGNDRPVLAFNSSRHRGGRDARCPA